jgi:hypothetical protein
MPTLFETHPITQSQVNDDNTGTNTNNPETDLNTLTKQKKRKVARLHRKSLDPDNHIINSYAIIPAEILGKNLKLKQPYEFTALKTELDEFDEMIINEYPTISEFTSIHRCTNILRTFKECSGHESFLYLASLNQIRDEDTIALVHNNTFPMRFHESHDYEGPTSSTANDIDHNMHDYEPRDTTEDEWANPEHTDNIPCSMPQPAVTTQTVPTQHDENTPLQNQMHQSNIATQAEADQHWDKTNDQPSSTSTNDVLSQVPITISREERIHELNKQLKILMTAITNDTDTETAGNRTDPQQDIIIQPQTREYTDYFEDRPHRSIRHSTVTSIQTVAPTTQQTTVELMLMPNEGTATHTLHEPLVHKPTLRSYRPTRAHPVEPTTTTMLQHGPQNVAHLTHEQYPPRDHNVDHPTDQPNSQAPHVDHTTTQPTSQAPHVDHTTHQPTRPAIHQHNATLTLQQQREQRRLVQPTTPNTQTTPRDRAHPPLQHTIGNPPRNPPEAGTTSQPRKNSRATPVSHHRVIHTNPTSPDIPHNLPPNTHNPLPPDRPNPFQTQTQTNPFTTSATQRPQPAVQHDTLQTQMARILALQEGLLTIQMQREQQNRNPDDSLTRILERSIEREDKKRLRKFEDYPEVTQLILRRMCVVDVYDEEPPYPSQICLDIINAGNKVQQTSFVTAYLKSKKVLGRWSTGHINRFIYGGPLWNNKNDPFGLTLFGIHNGTFMDPVQDKNLKLAIQYCMDDKIDKDDLEVLVRNDTHLPPTVHDIRIVLTTYEALLTGICTQGALIPQVIRSWVHHYDQNYEDYLTLFTERPKTFPARLLYAIDISLQMYIEKLGNNTIPMCDIPRHNIESEMIRYQQQIECRQFNTSLPPCLIALTSKDDKKRKADQPSPDPNKQNQYPNRNNKSHHLSLDFVLSCNHLENTRQQGSAERIR